MVMKKLLAQTMRIENQFNAVIARLPGINEQGSARGCKVKCIFVTQEIQRLSQRGAPGLIPSRLASGMTTAITNPAADAVRTAPRSAFAKGAAANFNVEPGRILVEIFAVIRELKTARRRVDLDCVGQADIAKLEMM